MRVDWLEDLLAVAETGSFSEAAERRRLTQSAFSRRIQSIEDHVGVELFDRTKKPVALRPTTLDQRERIADLAARLRGLVADLRRGERQGGNRIVVASQHALTAALTPALIERVLAREDDAYVRLRSANLDDCFAMLLARQAEIALVYRLPGAALPFAADYIETVEIARDRLVPVFATAGADRLEAWATAGDLPFIAYPGEVFLGEVMDRAILPPLRATLRPVPRVETALTLAALELAAQGLGVAWVPASLASARVAGGTLADLSDHLPSAALTVTAVRLAGTAQGIEAAVWEELQTFAGG